MLSFQFSGSRVSVLAYEDCGPEFDSNRRLHIDFVLQFPPAMIIKEGPNGTVTYSGYTLDTMFAIGRSLNLRYKTLNKRIKCV